MNYNLFIIKNLYLFNNETVEGFYPQRWKTLPFYGRDERRKISFLKKLGNFTITHNSITKSYKKIISRRWNVGGKLVELPCLKGAGKQEFCAFRREKFKPILVNYRGSCKANKRGRFYGGWFVQPLHAAERSSFFISFVMPKFSPVFTTFPYEKRSD